MLVKNWKAKFASSLKEAGYKNKQIAETVTIFEKGFGEYDPKSDQLLHGEIDILDVIYDRADGSLTLVGTIQPIRKES